MRVVRTQRASPVAMRFGRGGVGTPRAARTKHTKAATSKIRTNIAISYSIADGDEPVEFVVELGDAIRRRRGQRAEGGEGAEKAAQAEVDLVAPMPVGRPGVWAPLLRRLGGRADLLAPHGS